MPKTKPRRITISLTPALDAHLAAIAGAGGGSQSGLVIEILEAAEPTLGRMAAAFERIREASGAERAKMAAAMDVAQAVLETMAMDVAAGMVRAMERATGTPVATEAGAVPPRGPGVAASDVDPPSTNRGGRSPRKTGANSAKTRAAARSAGN